MKPSDNKVFRSNTNITSICLLHKNEGILLEAIIGDSFSITFGDGLVTVKPQSVAYFGRL